MPTYEYACDKCGHEFELFQRISDPPRKRCPKCRGAVRRKVGAGAGLLFKGSGFYITDYRSESYKKAAKAESGGSNSSSSSSSSTSSSSTSSSGSSSNSGGSGTTAAKKE